MLFLTPEELTEWTGYRRRGRIIETLRRWGVRFRIAGDGWPRVPRSAVDGAGNQAPLFEEGPNFAALGSLARPLDNASGEHLLPNHNRRSRAV